MEAALTGFIGVIAGAVTTGGVQFWISAQQRRNDALAAARLVYGALASATVELERTQLTKQWGAADLALGPPFAGNRAVWSQQRERLARVLDPAGFHCVDGAFDTLKNLDDALTLAVRRGQPENPAEIVLNDINFSRRLALLRQAEAVTARAGQR
jgi:hypothetical protein